MHVATQLATGKTADERRRVLVVLPFDMSFRNIVIAPVAAHLAADRSIEVTMVSRDARQGEQLARIGGGTIRWEALPRPLQQSLAPGLALPRRLRLLLADMRAVLGHYLFLALVYRFNSIAGFRGFDDRIRQSRSIRWKEFREGLPSLRWLGFPFPRSTAIFAGLKRIYFSGWQRQWPVEELFDRVRPQTVVVTHMQTSTVTPYILAARARGLPVLGLNGSWDQPTTKGPMLPGIERVLAQSRQVVDQLVEYHGYPRERTSVVGWPQMDIYSETAQMVPRAEFLAKLGLASGARYVLVAAYSDRLGRHEPEMCRALQSALQRGEFGADVCLYVRCHPLDRGWRERLGRLHAPPLTIVEPPELGGLGHLTNLIRHAAVVIASAGTINLDAVALDTPSIALAFDEADVPYHDQAARRYDMEHVAAVMATGGIRKVGACGELIAAVHGYMADRAVDAEGRARLREQHLAPLDGQSSARIAREISRFAHEHAIAAAIEGTAS